MKKNLSKKKKKKKKKIAPPYPRDIRRAEAWYGLQTWRQLNPSALMDLHRNDDLAWKSIRGETSRPPDHIFS